MSYVIGLKWYEMRQTVLSVAKGCTKAEFVLNGPLEVEVRLRGHEAGKVTRESITREHNLWALSRSVADQWRAEGFRTEFGLDYR